ncbi:MAG: ATP-binding cassette domain-containing protein [Planctomycetes bacterium]|nr:ATP-binding cassette domain-containing protein [Planctomycetota bacterium]
MNDSIVVQARNVNFAFGEGEVRKQVLFDNNLDIRRGELVIMTGPSGSGKTTLLTLIGGLRSTQEGSLKVLGQELSGLTDRDRVAVRRRLGFIFQLHNLFDSLTAIENVRMSMELHPYETADMVGRAREMLEKLGLGERIQYKPHALSGGQRQRVAIARALVNRPALILADEPTAALDKKSSRDVVDLLKALTREEGSTILMVTHDSRILDVADRIVNMVDGHIASDVAVRESLRIIELLKKSAVFKQLSPTEALNCAEKMSKEESPAQKVVFRQGDVGDKFYLIEKGAVDVIVGAGEAGRIVATLQAGDFFGEAALLTGETRNASILAREDCVFFTMSKENFQQTLASSETFEQQFRKVVFQRQSAG